MTTGAIGDRIGRRIENGLVYGCVDLYGLEELMGMGRREMGI